MAAEIQFADTTGQTCYANLVNNVGEWWNTVGGAFEAFNAANWADYDLAATEFGTSGIYRANMPAAAAGSYNLTARRRAGGSPAQSDPIVGDGGIEWSGTVVNSLDTVRLANGVTHGGDTAVFQLEHVAITCVTPGIPAVKIEQTDNSTFNVHITGGSAAVRIDNLSGLVGISVLSGVQGAIISGTNLGMTISGMQAGDITGNLIGNITGNLSGSIGSLATQAKTDVRTEVDAGIAAVGLTTTVTGRIDVATSTRAVPGDQMALTAGAITSVASAVWSFVTEGAFTAVQIMRGIASFVMGEASGGNTTAPTFRDLGDTKDRLVMTVDSSGNRTAVVRDLS